MKSKSNGSRGLKPPVISVSRKRVYADMPGQGADELHTQLEAEQHNILCTLSGLESDVSEMKRLICATTPDNLATLESFADLEAELRNHTQILSILKGCFNDMSKMKRLITAPLTPKDELIIQEEIMKRLPVKSLVRFRCVSRSWKSLIDSSKFIRTHKNQPKHLLVNYKRDKEGADEKFVSFADNDSFPHRRSFPALPPSIRLPLMAGSSYGLLCFYCYDLDMALIWNPSIKKSIAIDVHERSAYVDTLGFGVCPVTLDPKIVHITHLPTPRARRMRSTSQSKQQFGKFWKVNVYKLSSGKFRNLSSKSSKLPPVSVRITRWTQVVIDRLIYWCAEVDLKDGTCRSLIMSFDVTNEKFKAVDLPHTLASLDSYDDWSVSKIRESLVILEHSKDRYSYHVWKMMDNGLFTKQFTVCGSIMISAVGFSNTGGALISVEGSTSAQLVYEANLKKHTNLLLSLPAAGSHSLEGSTSTQFVYEPNSKKHSNILLSLPAGGYSVESYMETLLLIGRSDCISTSF